MRPFTTGTAVRVVVGVAIVCGLTLAMHRPQTRDAIALLQRPPAAPTIVEPAGLRLDEPGIDPVRIEPGRIDARTGLREDGLSRGSFTTDEVPVLRLAVTRGRGAERMPSLFVLVARRAAHAGKDALPLSVIRAGRTSSVATRFGVAEIAPMTLAGPVTRTCTGFAVVQAGLRIDGFLCAPLGGGAEPRTVACTLDALDLDDPADPTTTALFRQARSRSACGTVKTAQVDAVETALPGDRRRGRTKN